MDFKSTIDNTNKYKNDLKLAREKINDRIISGGGTIANTISDVPSAIDKLTKQYKKIAIMDFTNNPINIEQKHLNLNLEFNPSKLIIGVGLKDKNFQQRRPEVSYNIIPNPIPPPFDNSENWISYSARIGSSYYTAKVTNFNKREMTWEKLFVSNDGIDLNYVKIFYIIAIE